LASRIPCWTSKFMIFLQPMRFSNLLFHTVRLRDQLAFNSGELVIVCLFWRHCMRVRSSDLCVGGRQPIRLLRQPVQACGRFGLTGMLARSDLEDGVDHSRYYRFGFAANEPHTTLLRYHSGFWFSGKFKRIISSDWLFSGPL